MLGPHTLVGHQPEGAGIVRNIRCHCLRRCEPHGGHRNISMAAQVRITVQKSVLAIVQ